MIVTVVMVVRERVTWNGEGDEARWGYGFEHAHVESHLMLYALVVQFALSMNKQTSNGKMEAL